MKKNQIFAALIILSMLLCVSISRAVNVIFATQSGYWSSTNATSPWPNGILPTTNDWVEINGGIIITNDTTNAICQLLDSGVDGNGTLVMEPNSTLTIAGQNEGYGAQTLGALVATATNCTVIYQGNSFWAKRTNYWNLVFSGWGDFYNGDIPSYSSVPITIYGNFIVDGTNVPSDQPNFTGSYVQCGNWLTVDGNLYIGASNTLDCSTSTVVVLGNITCAGALYNAGGGSNYYAGNVTILSNNMVITNLSNVLIGRWTNLDSLGPDGLPLPGGQTNIFGGAWYVGNSTGWYVRGNLTNNGIIGFGQNYGSIDFTGTGVISGSPASTFMIQNHDD